MAQTDAEWFTLHHETKRAVEVLIDFHGPLALALAVGRGLMSLPRLLLLDEPSIGLSPMLVDAIMDAVVQIHQQGTAILLVEQNVFRSLTISHRAYTLENGSISLEGEGKALLDDPHILKAYLGI